MKDMEKKANADADENRERGGGGGARRGGGRSYLGQE